MPGPGPEREPSIVWSVETRGAFPFSSNTVVFEDLVITGCDGGFVYAFKRSDGRELWTVSTEGNIEQIVLRGETIFAVTPSFLYALDASTGATRWQFGPGMLWGGLFLIDDLVVVSSTYGLHALSAATGDEVWEREVGNLGAWFAEGMIYAIIYDNEAGVRLNAFDPRDQTQIAFRNWSVDGSERVAFRPIVASDRVYLGRSDGSLYAFDLTADSDSSEIWKRSVGKPILSALLIDNRLFVGAGNSLSVLDAKFGTLLWSVEASGQVNSISYDGVNQVCFGSSDNYVYFVDIASKTVNWRFEASSGVRSTPTIGSLDVYVGSDDGKFYAINRGTGGETWSAQSRGSIDSSPIERYGVLYVATKNGHLMSIDAFTGEPLWQRDLSSRITSTAAIAGDKLFIGSEAGELLALDVDTGVPAWTFDAQLAVNSSPLALGDLIFVAANSGTLHALEIGTGRERWSSRGEVIGSNPFVVPSSPASDGSTVFHGSIDGAMYAIDAITGEEIWRSEAIGFNFSSCAIDGETLFVTTAGVQATLYALDANSGAVRWSFPARSSSWVLSSPAIVSGVVAFVTKERIYGVDASLGVERWNVPSEGDRGYHPLLSSPVSSVGIFYVGALDGNVYALEAATGTEKWRIDVGAPVVASPWVVDGIVYVGTEHGHIYALSDLEESKILAVGERSGQTRFLLQFVERLAANSLLAQNLPLGFTAPKLMSETDSPFHLLPRDADGLSSVSLQTPANEEAIAVLVFCGFTTAERANQAFLDIQTFLLRGGWRQREATLTDHLAACATLQTTEGSEAICYVSRDDIIITAYSMLPLDAVDAVYLNVNDLARYGSDVYDRTDRPV